ncbi:hypothetical protein CWC15_15675 [Pseudoalteromonas spongiae]|nr:hypothetical protein CWC15_15675 [Pseudoalteromonas spongiae]
MPAISFKRAKNFYYVEILNWTFVLLFKRTAQAKLPLVLVFCLATRYGVAITDDHKIEGYASFFKA